MKFVRTLLAVAACAGVTACSTLPPSSSEIAQAPQVRFGQPLPSDKHYVLLFPAGTPLPTSVMVGGNLFEHDEQTTLHVTLKHDVYVYGKFASFDKQHWQPGFKLVDTRLTLEIPQKDGSNAGLLRLDMNEK